MAIRLLQFLRHAVFNPGEYITEILGQRRRYLFHIPLLITALSNSLNILDRGVSLQWNATVFLLGFVITYISLTYILPFLLYVTGRIWNDHGNFYSYQLIVSLAQLTVIPVLVMQLFHIPLALFNDGTLEMSLFGGRFLLDLALWLLMMRIFIICIARVKQVSYGVALLNFVLPALPIWILYLVL